MNGAMTCGVDVIVSRPDELPQLNDPVDHLLNCLLLICGFGSAA